MTGLQQGFVKEAGEIKNNPEMLQNMNSITNSMIVFLFRKSVE